MRTRRRNATPDARPRPAALVLATLILTAALPGPGHAAVSQAEICSGMLLRDQPGEIRRLHLVNRVLADTKGYYFYGWAGPKGSAGAGERSPVSEKAAGVYETEDSETVLWLVVAPRKLSTLRNYKLASPKWEGQSRSIANDRNALDIHRPMHPVPERERPADLKDATVCRPW